MKRIPLVACLVLTCVPVDAASLTYSVAYSNYGAALPLPKFMESPGITLYEVDLTASGETIWDVSVAPGLSSGTYSAEVHQFLFDVPLGSSTHDFAFTFPTPQSTVTLGNSWSFDCQFTDGLEPFTGNDTYFISGYQGHQFLTTDVPLVSWQDTSVYGIFEFTVTYNFTVPEPPTMTMGIVAIGCVLGLAMARKGAHRA